MDDQYKFIGELGDDAYMAKSGFFVCMCVIAILSMSLCFVKIYIIYFKEGKR